MLKQLAYKLQLGAFLLAVFIASCSGSIKNDPNATLITGKLANVTQTSIYLDELGTNSTNRIDTASIDSDGEFIFSLKALEKTFYKVTLANNNFVVLIVAPKEKVNIAADATNMEKTYQVEGSEESMRLKQLNQYMVSVYYKRDSLVKIIQAYQAKGDVEGSNAFLPSLQKMGNEQNQFIKDFIDQQPATLASLAAVHQLDPEQDFDYLLKVEEAMKKTMPNSMYSKDFSNKIQQLQTQAAPAGKLSIGDEAPEITLNNPEGKTISLSSLRGKVVLVDFWASWCKPCRMENPNVVALYEKYNGKGFEIFGVSLDKDKGAWTKAIAQDKLTWTHVSDLAFWNSAPAKLYGIQSIPSTYLLDKEGKIIARDLRGEPLEKKIEEFLGK